MTLEEQRYYLRYEIENALIEVIHKRGSYHIEAERLFRTWCEDEDGNLAIDRLINLIIH